MNKGAQEEDELYTVRATSRLSGVPASTIRNWEGRHGAVRPARTNQGQRRFTSSDVERLSLLSQLTEQGHAISEIAAVSSEKLRALSQEMQPEARPVASTLRVVTVGARAGAHVQALAMGLSEIELLRQFSSPGDLRVEDEVPDCDLLVVHMPQLRDGSLATLQQMRARLEPSNVLVIYEFGRLATVRSLRGSDVSVLQGFGHFGQFMRVWLPGQVDVAPAAPVGPVAVVENRPRSYTVQELLEYSAADPTGLLCECRRHLASMLMQLYDFEDYTEGCAEDTPEDAEAHAEIRGFGQEARQQIEQALQVAINHGQKTVSSTQRGVEQ